MEGVKISIIDIQSSGFWPLRTNVLIGKDLKTDKEIARTETSGFEGNTKAFRNLLEKLEEQGYLLDEDALNYAQAELRLDMPFLGEFISLAKVSISKIGKVTSALKIIIKVVS